MTTVQITPTTPTQVGEAARVVEWRYDQLRRVGYDTTAASALAERRDIDLHAATELVARGCPPRLAARILD